MKKFLLSLVVLATALSANAQIQRMVVVEEFTGTGCGWCPRGLAGMDWLKATYEDKCIGIALHQYNSSDPTYITKYASLPFQGAPQCMINRMILADPYYGREGTDNFISQAVDYYATFETHAYVESISAAYQDENMKKVDITASVNFDADGDYSVAFVLTGDSLTGESSAWKQSNYYTSNAPSGDPLIDQFCNGGEYGQSQFYWKFNDVALAASYNANGENLADALQPAQAGVSQSVSYTLGLPTKTQMLKAMRKDLISAIVLIIDNENGYIVNAARVQVPVMEDPTAISATSKEATAVAFYNAEGKVVSAPQKGLNIVKMSDGSIKKVMY